MLQNKYQQISDLLLLFITFFLSNFSAFIHYIWLIPEVVLIETAIWLIVAIVIVWILKRHGLLSVFVANLGKNWIILPFAAYAGFSIFWSVSWEISLSRWLILLFTIITGGYIGLRYTMDELVRYLSVFGVYILVVSSLFILLIPDLGVMNYYTIHGAWKGLYWHKNHMGFVAAFTNTLFLINIVYSFGLKRKLALPWIPLYLFSLFFVYQTDSVAAYITTVFLHVVIILTLLLLKYRERLRSSNYVIFGIIVIVALIVLYDNLDLFFKFFNRSPTLTGRLPMWSILFETYFSRRPVLGYGFNAFWYVGSYRVAMGLAAGYPDQIVIADNGFIDILMNTGYFGLALFLLFYFGAWARSVRYAAKAKDIIGLFPVFLMVYTLMANVSWSLIFENEGFFMLIIISVLFCVANGSASRNQDR